MNRGDVCGGLRVCGANRPTALHKRLSDMGMVPLGKKSLPELDAFVKSVTAKWAPVIRNAGLAGSQ